MIISALLTVVKTLIEILFGWVSLPDVPEAISVPIDTLFDYMRDGLGILWLFLDQNVVLVLLPLTIAVLNFDHLYKFGMWILRKIPMIGVD